MPGYSCAVELSVVIISAAVYYSSWRVIVSNGPAISASKSSIRRFVITEKAPTRAFSWLKARKHLSHYAEQANYDADAIIIADGRL